MDLCEALTLALARPGPPVPPDVDHDPDFKTVAEFVRQFGTGGSGLRRAALWLVGEPRIPSRRSELSRWTAYRSARRRLERALAAEEASARGGKQKRPATPKFLGNVRGRIRHERPREGERGRKVDIYGTVRVSRDERRRRIRGVLSAKAMRELRRALGDCDELTERFAVLFASENRMGATPEWSEDDVTVSIS